MARLGGRFRLWWLMAAVAVVAVLCAVFRDGGPPGFVIALIAAGVFLAACTLYSKIVAWRVTPRWMIGATAAVAVVLAAAPSKEPEGTLFAAVIAGACVLALAFALCSEIVAPGWGLVSKACLFLAWIWAQDYWRRIDWRALLRALLK